MVTTLVTGATGTLGTAVRPKLVNASHTVRAASRSPPAETGADVEWIALDLVEDGEIASAVSDVDVVIHAATAPQGNTAAVDVNGTDRLLEAAADAGVEHFVYPSIVGIDDIPYSYYERKRAAESLVEESSVPTTIVRATQFHTFIAELFESLSKLPVWPLPTKLQVQPIAVETVADIVVDYTTETASGRTDPIGGPQVLSVGELARSYRDVRGWRRPIFRFPVPGSTAAAFRAGRAVCPDHAVGTVTWEQWLVNRYTCEPDATNTGDQRTE